MKRNITLLCLFLFSVSSISLNAQNFGSFASAIWLTDCTTSNFFNTTGEGSSLIGPPENIFAETNFGVFMQNSGTFILRGGEVKTFKNNNGNACSVRMNYRTYLTSETPGGFNIIDFPFFEDCNVGSSEFPSGGPCSQGDQKWQRVIADGTTSPFSPVDLTLLPPGSYALEVYFDITGDLNSDTECDDIIFISNFGNNFKAYFTLTASPFFIPENPATCGGSEGNIIISNLNAGSTYLFSYSDDGEMINPVSITADENGQYMVSNLNAGIYSDFNLTLNGCTATSNTTLNLSDPVVNPPATEGNQTVCETNPIQTLTAGASTNDDSVVVWYDAETGGNIVANPVLDSVGSITYYAEAQHDTLNCISSVRTAVTLVINPAPPAPTGETPQSICSTAAVIFTLNDLVVNGNNLQWYADENLTIPLLPDHPLANNITYYVTQNTGGCESNEHLAVQVILNAFETPVFDFGTSIALCNGNEAPVLPEISQNGFVGYWLPATIDNTQNGSYYFFSENNCALDFTLQVTVNPIPDVPEGESIQQICSDAATIFSLADLVVSGSDIQWYADTALLTSLPPNTPLTDSLTYYATQTVNGCESEPLSVFVILNTWVVPDFSFNNEISICSGETAPGLPLTDNNGISGTWNPALIDNTQSGNYTFLPTLDCAAPFSVNVTVNQPTTPVFNFGNELTICTVAQAPVLPSTDNNGISGEWSPPVINASGNYIFIPTDGQCADNFMLTVTVSSFPTPVFTFGHEISICSGSEAPDLPNVDNNGINGFWIPSAINNITGGTYTFIANDSQCAGNFDLTVVINQPTAPVFSLPESVCYNNNTLTLPAISDNGISGSWNPPIINPTQETNYIFTPLNAACTTSFSVTISVLTEFPIAITDQCINNQFIIGVELTNNSDIILTDYTWMNENGITIGTNSSTLNVTEYIRSTPETETFPIEFKVRATSADGCFAEETISIPFVYCGIQKGISPNDDNRNDFFDLALLDVDKLSIFNRYGKKVYALKNYTNQWHGQTDDGKELPSATYYYVIELRNGESKTGWIYVMREESR